MSTLENAKLWDWAIRSLAPLHYDLVPELAEHAAALRALPEIRTPADLESAATKLVEASRAASSVLGSVRGSVRASLWASLRDSGWDSGWDSLLASLWDSLLANLWDSLRDSLLVAALRLATSNGPEAADELIRRVAADFALGYAAVMAVEPLPDIHRAVYEAASRPGALDMSTWHCGTAHCRAGWVTTLAGEAGRRLEGQLGTAAAAALIYAASDPELFEREGLPEFYADNDEALADMARLAGVSA